MIKWKFPDAAALRVKKKTDNRNAMRGGSYSLMITVVVLAILVAVNVFVSVLPSSITRYDISAMKLYSITSNTKVVVNSLEEDITIYWVVQSGKEDDVVENLLSKYESLSDHIEVVKKNPDVFPTFAEQYTSETVENNSLIVECGDRSRFIGYDDIYVQEGDMYSYTYSTSFDGEGAVTSAIDYVISEELPQVYVLEGHGEADLPSTFSEQIEKENMEVSTFSLLNVDEIPEEADCIIIYGPESDISKKEKDILSDYVEEGGRLLVMAGPVEDDSLDNLYSLLSDYGVEANEGIVVEGDREHYAFQTPYMLLPDMKSDEITDSLIEENYYPILPLSLGLTVTGSSSRASVSTILSTSEQAFSKIDGYAITTYEKEEGDIDGPFALAVSVECDGGGRIVWFSSSAFLEDMYNAYASGANVDLGINALSSLIGESEAMAIRSKSLNYNYLTISESAGSLLKVTMIGIFPLMYLGTGIYVTLKRRRKQNETG
ncbi:MAG: GldG family protein [Emergencia sp.]